MCKLAWINGNKLLLSLSVHSEIFGIGSHQGLIDPTWSHLYLWRDTIPFLDPRIRDFYAIHWGMGELHVAKKVEKNCTRLSVLSLTHSYFQ